MFGLFKRKKQSRESFLDFLFQHRHLSLEAVLDKYIATYSLAVRRSLDELEELTDKRTKLEILEESGIAKNCNDPQISTYVLILRQTVEMLESLDPEVLDEMKKRQR